MLECENKAKNLKDLRRSQDSQGVKGQDHNLHKYNNQLM